MLYAKLYCSAVGSSGRQKYYIGIGSLYPWHSEDPENQVWYILDGVEYIVHNIWFTDRIKSNRIKIEEK